MAAAAAVCAGALAGCAPQAATLPLAGAPATVWDVRAARAIDLAELATRVAPVRFRLLGEVHDNPEHHHLRAELVAGIARAGKRPALVLEQFDLEAEAAMQAAQQAGVGPEGLATAGRLDRRAWGWPLHAPVLDAALRAYLPVHAGNLSRAVLGRVARTGALGDTAPALRNRLDRAAWTTAQDEALLAQIRSGHCNRLPDSAVPRLALAQRVRDAAMADALERHATVDGAILIAGNGHVRRDTAVPVYLAAPAPDVVVVAWLEVTLGDRQAPDFPRNVLGDTVPYDYVVFTAPVARPDPCLGMG